MPWPAVPHDAIRAGVASICINSVEQNCATSEVCLSRADDPNSHVMNFYGGRTDDCRHCPGAEGIPEGLTGRGEFGTLMLSDPPGAGPPNSPHRKESEPMNSYSAMLRNIVLQSALAALCCIAVGLLRFGTAIGNIHAHTFAVIPYGIMISLFFFVLRDAGIREAVFTLLGLFLLNAGFLTKSLLNGTLLTDAVLISALGLATVIYHRRYYHRGPRRRLLEPVALGVLVGSLTLVAIVVGYAFMGQIAGLMDGFPGSLVGLLHTVSVEFFVGLGVGIGIILSDSGPVTKALRFTA